MKSKSMIFMSVLVMLLVLTGCLKSASSTQVLPPAGTAAPTGGPTLPQSQQVIAVTPTVAPTPTVSKPAASTPVASSSNPTAIKVGLVYPLAGAMADWGKDAQPFIDAAQTAINASSAATTAGKQFNFVVQSDDQTKTNTLAAVKDLVEKEKVSVIVGLPTDQELGIVMSYLAQHHILVISSSPVDTNPSLRKSDLLYRIAPSETYLAQNLGQFAIQQGFTKALIVYSKDSWGTSYANTVAAQFKNKKYQTTLFPVNPSTGANVSDYGNAVKSLAAKATKMGVSDKLVVILALEEGQDLDVMHYAAQDSTFANVRLLSANLYPSLLTGKFGTNLSVPDARDFALAHSIWGVEPYINFNTTVTDVYNQASTTLGHAPMLEHFYLYDAMQLAAQAILQANSNKVDTIVKALPTVAKNYQGTTGVVHFDKYGDRDVSDLGFFGLSKDPAQTGDAAWSFKYYAMFDSAANKFNMLSTPTARQGGF
jgi:ABC-type branched-subunit amino acid transport system substrate-binding protein